MVGEGYEIFRGPGTTGNAYVMVLGPCVPECLVLPVDTFHSDVVVSTLIFVRDSIVIHACIVIQRRIVSISLYLEFHEIIRSQDIESFRQDTVRRGAAV